MDENLHPEPSPGRPWKGLAIFGTLLAAAIFRIWHLTTQNLWNDEVYSWDVARKPLDQIVDCAKADVHPPVYYIFLKGWTRLFGESPTALRSLSVVAGLIALWLGFRLFRKFADFKTALLTTALLGISAHQVFYAQEARMYAPVMALLLGAALGYHEWIESRGTSFSGLSTYFWCGLTALYFHYFTMFALAAFAVHFLVVLFLDQNPDGATDEQKAPSRLTRLRDWMLAHVALGILFSPWIPVFLEQAGRGQTWRKKLTPADVVWNIAAFVQEATLGYSIFFDNVRDWLTRLVTNNVHLDRWFFSSQIALNSGIVVFLCGLALWGIIAWLENRSRPITLRLFPVILFGVPLFIASAASLRQSLQLSRYLIYITPFLFFFIAYGCLRLKNRWVQIAVGAICVVSLLQGMKTHYAATARDSDLRPALTFIKNRIAPDDRIVIDPDSVDICLFYYAGVYGLSDRVYGAQVVPTGEPNGQGQLERMRTQKQISHWWVVLDYRSRYFEKVDRFDDFTVVSTTDFPDRYPKVRVLELRRK